MVSSSSPQIACNDTAQQLTHSLVKKAFSSVSSDLETLEGMMIGLIPSESRVCCDVIHHLLSAGGKRIRPGLFFMATNLVGYRGPFRLPIAAVCEFVHTASLLHDDVVDNAPLRRSRPTAKSLWGDVSAVLVGDLMYSRASEIMASSGELEIVSSFARAIRLMSEGELIQLEALYSFENSQKNYFSILTKKTACLIGAACRSAGVLAHSSLEIRTALEQIGYNVGIAFQLVDDALDYLSAAEQMGKETLVDLKEGKITLPFLLLYERATAEEKRFLDACLENPTSKSLREVCELAFEYNTPYLTLQEADTYTERALSVLSQSFPPSQARLEMVELITQLLQRTV